MGVKTAAWRTDRSRAGATALCFLLLTSAWAGAQESSGDADVDTPTLPTIVVTAERREATELETTQHVSVVTAEEIRSQGGDTTPDALSEEPGVWVQKTALGHGSPFIRGLTGKQVLILVDGVRFNNSTFRFGPNQYLNTIDPSIIDRIEIVRGPGSAMYGSDALGGVINIITHRRGEFGDPPEPGTDCRLYEQYSSAARGSISRFDVEGGAGNMAYTVGAGYKVFDDLRAGRGESPVGAVDTDGVQTPSGYDEVDFNASMRYVLASNQELRAAYLFTRQEDVPRSDKVIASDYNTNPEERYFYDPQQMQLAYVEYESRDLGAFDALKLNLSYNHQLEGRERRKAGWTKTRFEEDEIGTVGFSTQVAVKPLGGHTLTIGLETYADSISSARYEIADAGGRTDLNGRFPDGSSYSSFGLYVRDEISVAEKVDLALGARYSSFEADADFGGLTITTPTITIGPLDEISKEYSDTTWSFETMYHVNDDSKLYLNIARGFRAPNMDDLAVEGDWSSGQDVPNPDLSPEQAVNYEVGFKHGGETVSGGLSLFYADYTDLIQRNYLDPGLDGTPGTSDDLYQFQNVGEAEIYGTELWGKVQVGDTTSGRWSVFGNLAYTYGRDLTDDEPLTRIPPSNGLVGVRWDHQARRGWTEFFVKGAAKQDRLSSHDISDNRIPAGGTPGWVTVNLRGGVKLSERVSVTLGAFNLGDVRYRLHGSGLDAPGLNVVTRLECRF